MGKEKVPVKVINHERMNRWRERLNENHSTPVICVGVGHDHLKGKIMILCTEDQTDAEVLLFLKEAVKQLQGY